MSIELKIVSVVFLVFLILLILYLVKKEKIVIKYSLVWLIPAIILLCFVLIPGLLLKVTRWFGSEISSNMILAFLIGLLLIISLALTVIVSHQKEQIRLLIQEVSLLKKEK